MQVYYLIINQVGSPIRAIMSYDRKYLEKYAHEYEITKKTQLSARYYIFAESVKNEILRR